MRSSIAIVCGFIVCVVLWSLGAESSPAWADEQERASPTRHHGGDAVYLEVLLARARERGIAKSAQWLRLGHWRRPWWSGIWFVGRLAGRTSQADGAALFLAANGKHSPEAELEATLRALMTPVTMPALDTGDNAGSYNTGDNDKGDNAGEVRPSSHAQCRFPARLMWLRRVLDIDLARLPDVHCPALEEYRHTLRPKAVAVVFSAYYLGSAASAYGHTFLRIERHGHHEHHTHTRGGHRGQLLDVGVDYAAEVTSANPIIYGLRGLGGGFRGLFRAVPYYQKVRLYSDHEKRDLWEYRLALSEDEMAMFVAHLWELGFTHFDYFFLSENCSYHVLSALEVANPQWHLLDRLKLPVLPADTIRALMSVPGLVTEVAWRPSRTSQFRQRLAGMSALEQDWVLALMNDSERAFPDDFAIAAQVRVLDAAADLVDLRAFKELALQIDEAPKAQKLRLLSRRAALAVPSARLAMDGAISWERRGPERGHGTRRIGIGLGMTDEHGPHVSLMFRANLHDLADPDPGYAGLSALEFLPLELHIERAGRQQRPQLRLERMSLLRIVELSPLDRFQRHLSWQLDLGAERLYDQGCRRCLATGVLLGAGTSAAWLRQRVAGFLLVEGQARAASGLDGVGDWPLRLGLGPVAGLRVRFRPNWIAYMVTRWTWLPRQRPTALWSTTGTMRFGLGKGLAVDIQGQSRAGTLGLHTALMYYY